MFVDIIEAHVDLHDASVEKEVVSKWREIAARIGRGIPVNEKEWEHFVLTKKELNENGIDILQLEVGDSIRVWLVCRSFSSVYYLQNLSDEDKLRDILKTLVTYLSAHERHAGERHLEMTLRISSEQFKRAVRYFQNRGMS